MRGRTMNLADPIIVALITVVGGGIVTLILKVTEKRLGRPDAQRVRDENVANGLRTDLERKQNEIIQLKQELKEIEELAESYREKYWALYSELAEIRVQAFKAMQHSGISIEDMEAIIHSLKGDDE